MALGDKIRNAAEDLTGKATEADGKTDQSVASAKKTGEDVEDILR